MNIEKEIENITAEELGFEIHPNCKLCNSLYKLEIDKMIMDEVKTSSIVKFCMVVDPTNGKQRIAGSMEAITKNIFNHKKHLKIDKTELEEVQRRSMVLYKRKAQGEASLGVAKQLATERMVDELNNADNIFSLQDLAVPINLEQKERSVKVEEGALQINFAKFVKSNNNEQISGNEAESLKNSIRELNERIENVGREIRSIEGPREAVRS